MNEMPLWLASGPATTGTAAGIGAARIAGRKARKRWRVEGFMVVGNRFVSESSEVFGWGSGRGFCIGIPYETLTLQEGAL